MRILQISTAIEKKFGGPPNVVLNVQIELSKRKLESKTIIFGQVSHPYSPLQNLKRMHPNNLIIFKAKKSSEYGKLLKLREFRKFIKIYRESEIVIAHQLYNFQNVYLLIVLYFIKRPVVIIPHGTLTSVIRKNRRLKKKIADKLIYNKLINRSMAIGFSSQLEYEQLPERLKSKSLYFGIGIPARTPKSELHPRENTGKNFLFIGRITPIKNLDLTIRGFFELKQRFPGIKLNVAGDGSNNYMNKLKSLVSELSLQDTVEFHGWAEDKYKDSLFKANDYAILNSESENFSIAIAEAQCWGLPVLVTKNIGISSQVNKFGSGVVIDHASVENIYLGVTKLISLDYSKLSESALRCSEDLLWSKVIGQWLVNFEEILKRFKDER